ncbi:prolyl oligopeptidase family serine peptidase [Streptomyces sp. ODS28]|uniref:S9 family peptidase n=1 Tax=Streptomyces sp. ODS28 TaxID=3136688 RepID=UPI0031E51C1D
MATTFPQQYARTQRFTLGAPRAVTVSPDGARAVFLRSRAGDDRGTMLWVRETGAPDGAPGDTGGERADGGREFAAADPRELLGGAEEDLSPEERARRERAREGAGGIVGYATDTAVELASFALSGRLFAADLRTGEAREIGVHGPVVDPRPSPDGSRIAYVHEGSLRAVEADGTGDRALARPDQPGVTFGLAEFIAAEEMARSRGFWWSPDSRQVLAARADDSAVHRWWIADPANPDQGPTETAYPAAGTPNADVTLHLIDAAPRSEDEGEGEAGGESKGSADGNTSRRAIIWDRIRYPYLARVHWSSGGPPLLLVQSRDQRSQLVLAVDTDSGTTTPLHAEDDPDWLELFPGVPAWTPDGRLVRMEDKGGVRSLVVGDRVLTTGALHVRGVLDVGEEDVLFSASPGAEAEDAPVGDIGVYRAHFAGSGDKGGWERLAVEDAPHVASAARGGDVLALATSTLDSPGSRITLLRLDGDGGLSGGTTLPSYAQEPRLTAAPRLVRAGEREIPSAVLLPREYEEGQGPLPVLLDPYGGPHGARVVAAHNAYLTSQWFADQGFAVVIADGRGTPGRSPGWEKAISRDMAPVVLQDQVDALHALAESFPLDLGRVGIRGWSFGGYLAALAVLRRPDVFHSAVAGAPVTDWRLYDTHYTERYCGTPAEDPGVYADTSLVTDEGLSGAAEQHRPLMLIHGLADDNVAAAHTLRLSSALLAEGRPHEVLPLSGVTHMTPQEQVAENLLLLQVAFLKRTLGVRD